MPFKVTMLLEQATGIGGGGTDSETRLAGWSESVWSSETSLASLLPLLFGPVPGQQGLCPARARILPQGGQIMGQRVAPFDINLNRLGKAQTFHRIFPGGANATDLPNMSLQCTSPSASSLNVRHYAIRDIPDGQVTFGEFTPDFGYANAVGLYLNELASWQFLGQDLTTPVVTVLSVDTQGNWNTVGPHSFLVGDKVQFKRILTNLGHRYYSGVDVVTAIGPAANQLKTTYPSGYAASGGTLRKYVPKLFTMQGIPNATWDRISSRKVGRPFAQFRGRRSKKKVS